MHAVVAFVLVCGAGWLLISALGRARGAAGAVRATGGGRGGQRSVRQEAKLAWEKVRAADWLELQRHQRKNAPAEVTTAPPRRQLRRRGVDGESPSRYQELRERYLNRQRDGSPDPGGGTGSGDASPPPPTPPDPPHQRPPGTVNGRTPDMSGNPLESFVEALHQLHGQATSGGMVAKHQAVKAFTEASLRCAGTAAQISRAMAEPSAHYGPECTEPVARAAEHFQAASMTLSEADTALTTLGHMTVDELARSGRQAPHHSELNEGSAH